MMQCHHHKNIKCFIEATVTLHRHRFEIEGEVYMVALQDNAKPRFVKKALSDSNTKEWIDAMKDEMESIQTNQI